MWILIIAALNLNSDGLYVLNYDQLTLYKTLKGCENKMDQVYKNLKILEANYPVEVRYKTDYDNQKFIKYSYKPDYTKPKVDSYYHCKKIKNNNAVNKRE